MSAELEAARQRLEERQLDHEIAKAQRAVREMALASALEAFGPLTPSAAHVVAEAKVIEAYLRGEEAKAS